MLFKKKSDYLKAIVSAVDIERADVYVENMYCRQYYSIPISVESVLESGSVCVVPTLTHNLVKNICSLKCGMREVKHLSHTSLGLTNFKIRRIRTRNGSSFGKCSRASPEYRSSRSMDEIIFQQL